MADEVLRLGVPAGWIELKAFASDEAAAAWFDDLLRQTPGLDEEADRARLRTIHATVRGEVAALPVDSAGAFFTVLDDHRPTLWVFTITQIAFPPSGDVSMMGVIERFLASTPGRAPLRPDDLVESFRTQDGRDGVAVHTTGELSPAQREQLAEHLPATDPDRLGVVVAALQLPRQEGSFADRAVVVTGVSPTVEERLLMSLVAAHITLSAQVQAEHEPVPPGRVAVPPAEVGSWP